MNGLLRHSTLLGSQLREDRTVVAPGFLQNPAVRNWLGGIVPAWTMLDQKSFEALRLPPRLAVKVGCLEPTTGYLKTMWQASARWTF